MNLVLLLLTLFSICLSTNIISRPIHTTYNQYGQAKTFQIQFKLFNEIYENDFLKIVFPQSIHSLNNFIIYSLSTATQQKLIQPKKSLIPTGSAYSLTMIYLPSNTWYQLTIQIEIPPTITYGLVSISFVSGGNIEYAWNKGFQYYHIDKITNTSVNIGVSITNVVSNAPSSIYPIQLQITPTLLSSTPTILTIKFTNTTIIGPAFNYSTVFNYFIFTGTCQISCQNVNGCLYFTSCIVNNDGVQLNMPYLNQTFTLELWVRNPDFVSMVGIQCFWAYQSGAIAGIGIINNALWVSSIQILPNSIYLLWGIPYQTVVSMGFGIFLNGALNNLDIGFMMSSGTPISTQLIVSIYLGGQGILQSSINHNLPQINSTTKVECSYSLPYLICKKVGAFSRINYRYYIRVKAYFTSTSVITQFGSVSISLQSGKYLIDPLNLLLAIPVLNSADYLDHAGLHSGSQKIMDTIIVSMKDTLEPNSTANNIYNFINSNNSFVGIDTSINQQQLLFLLKVSPNQMANPALTTNQTYLMKIYYNNKIMTTSNLGLDFAAYNTQTNKWDLESTPCYVNSSTSPLMQIYMCQKYQDHTLGLQVDNTYSTNSDYGLYQWRCGNGVITHCASGDCQAACQIFKGYGSLIQGNGGVISIRNVVFNNGYFSPILANDQVLDFIIAFYHGSTLISASLINAYSMNSHRLSYIQGSIINQYNDGAKYNDGSRIPTMISLYGLFSLSELPNWGVSSIQIFIPNTLKAIKFNQGYNTYGCSTNKCILNSNAGITINSVDTWIYQSSIQIFNLPSLTENFRMLIPIQSTGIVESFTIILKDYQSNILKIYRLNGSSIQQSLTPIGSKSYLAQIVTYPNLWSGTLWVSNNALYSYKQQININNINQQALQNTIIMNGSVLPNGGKGSCTFASAFYNIYSDSSVLYIDYLRTCIGPFSYMFNSLYKIYVIWCPTISLVFNTINITYPLYPTVMGAGFPYNLVFAASFSIDNGIMHAYRQQTKSKSSQQLCTTSKSTEYNLLANQVQENIFSIIMKPFKLSQSLNTIQLELILPLTIPLSVQSCSALQVYSLVILNCAFIGAVSNVYSFTLTYLGTIQTLILSLEIKLKTTKVGVSTASGIQSYTVSIYLPQTNAGVLSVYGTQFSPFRNKIYACSNSFTYSSIALTQFIDIKSSTLLLPNIYSSSSMQQLTLNIKFSSAGRTNFFSTSKLLLTFTQNILDPIYSRCSINPDYHNWLTINILSPSSVQFIPKFNIPGFALLDYSIVCSNIHHICPLSVTVFWQDSGITLQQSVPTIIFCNPPLTTKAIYSNYTVTLSKQLSTNFYFGNYHLIYNFPIVINSLHQIYISIPLRNYDYNLLECFYVENGTTPIQTICQILPTNIISIKVYPSSNLNNLLNILINGIPQEQFSQLNIHTQIQTINEVYFFQILDTIPTTTTNQPIIITNVNAINNQGSVYLTLEYMMPLSYNNYSGELFVQIDQVLTMIDINHQFNLCQINTFNVTCVRFAKNLIKIINNIVNHTAGISYKIQIHSLYPLLQIPSLADGQYLQFHMFITDVAYTQVLVGSHTHLENPIPLSSIINTNIVGLQWIIPNNYSLYKVYVGYYSEPVKLLGYPYSVFSEQFPLLFTRDPLYNYSIIGNNAKLGYNSVSLSIAIPQYPSLIKIFSTIKFSHTSLYYSQPDILPIQISTQKCLIKSQYPYYDIFPGGITLPILINFTKCRPIIPLTISYNLNTTAIEIDTSLSNYVIVHNDTLLYITLRHSLSTFTVNQNFSLTVTLFGANNIYYLPISPIIIRVFSKSNVIGNPQPKEPILNQLTHKHISLTLQCNEPSKIYWALGLYPSVLGILAQEIQARLIQSKLGLKNRVFDPYEWSLNQYGLNYVISSNIASQILIDGLIGNMDYTFKYFCIGQLGSVSGGKILNFKSPNTNYSLNKIALTFSDMLTYQQSNTLACSLSQTLSIPYSSVTTSTFSNCYNTSQVFYNGSQKYYDQIINKEYSYLYYIDTIIKSNQQIQQILISKLHNANIFMNASVNLYLNIRIDQLLNKNTPLIQSMSYLASLYTIKITIDVGTTNSYGIVAIMDMYFDNQTMSLPSHYLIKQGYFSTNKKFQTVLMKYGRGNLTMQFINLNNNQKYSIFYFSTVDDPSLKSKHTQIKYINVQTLSILSIDLYSKYLLVSFSSIILFVLLL